MDLSTTNDSIANTTSDQYNSINLIIKKLGIHYFRNYIEFWISILQFKKILLGHELEEIRIRSLDNLISKLDNHVISESDLCQHKQLFIKLFELFNYSEFNQYEKVLNLLCKLSNVKIFKYLIINYY